MKYTFVLATGVGIGGLFGYHLNFDDTRFTLQTLDAANRNYLIDRFVKAYEQEPTAIALWEGTNLVASLTNDTKTHLPKEERAEMLAIHCRLSRLFTETGSSDDANIEAEEARRWFDTIVSNQQSISSAEVVKRFLNEDSVKRKTGSK